MECLPNKLTPLYSKIYYKEENSLKAKTAVFKYITPPHSKGWYVRYVRYARYVGRSHRSTDPLSQVPQPLL